MRSTSSNKSLVHKRLTNRWPNVGLSVALGALAANSGCSDPDSPSLQFDAGIDASLNDASLAASTIDASAPTSTGGHTTRTTQSTSTAHQTSGPSNPGASNSQPPESTTTDPISNVDASVNDAAASSTRPTTTTAVTNSTVESTHTNQVSDAQASQPGETDAGSQAPEFDASPTSQPVDLDAGMFVDASNPEPNPAACSFEKEVVQFDGSLEKVVLGPQGSLYLLGSQNNEATLRKLDAQGTVAWTWRTSNIYGPLVRLAVSATGVAYMTRSNVIFRVGDDGVELPSWSRSDLELNDVVVDPTGNVWVAGKTGESLYTLAKLSSDGDELWAQAYPASGMALYNEWIDLPMAPNGDVFATYRTGGSMTEYGIDIYRHENSTGERTTVANIETFNKNIGSLSGQAAALDSNRVVAVAETLYYSNTIVPGEFARVARAHPNGYAIDGGRSFYPKPLPLEPDDIATAGFARSVDLVTDASDRLILLGTTNGEFTRPSAGRVDSFIAVWHPDSPGGELVQFGTAGNDRATSLALSPEGELWITGNTDGSFTDGPAKTQSFLMHTALGSLRCNDTSAADGGAVNTGLTDGGTGDSVEPAIPDAATVALDAGLLDGDAAAYGQTELWSHEDVDYTPIAIASSGNFFVLTNTAPLPAVMQVDPAWNIISTSEPSFPDSAPEPFRAVPAIDHAGSALVWNYDADVLEKFSVEGELLWSQPMNTSAGPQVAIDTNDNLLLVWSQNNGPGQGDQWYLTKWDPEGMFQWQEELPDLTTPSVTVNFAGDILVAGSTFPIYERSEVDVIVFHASGEFAWSKMLPTQGPDRGFRSAALDNDLAVSIGLNTEEWGDHVVKLDASGNTQWTQRYPWGTKIVRVVADQAENVTVLAQMRSAQPITPDWDVFVHQLNPRGEHRWVERFATAESELADAAVIAPNGDVLATLHTRGMLTNTVPAGNGAVFIRFPANHAPTVACFVEPCDD